MCAAEDSSGEGGGRLSKRSVRLLLAEGDQELRRLLSWSLRNEGYDVTECTNGVDLLDYLRAFLDGPEDDGFRLIVSDLRMPGAMGLSVLEQASRHQFQRQDVGGVDRKRMIRQKLEGDVLEVSLHTDFLRALVPAVVA